MVSSREPRGARTSACILQLLESSHGQEGEGGEYSVSGSRLCRDALDVRAEGKQSVQYYSEEFRLRVVVKARVFGIDCELPIRLMALYGDECHFTFVGIEDYFLRGVSFGDRGDHTL